MGRKDLYTEAERILARTGSGMSLLERLVRDATLRADLLAVLKEMKTAENPLAPVAAIRGESSGKSKKPRSGGDMEMKDVPV